MPINTRYDTDGHDWDTTELPVIDPTTVARMDGAMYVLLKAGTLPVQDEDETEA